MVYKISNASTHMLHLTVTTQCYCATPAIVSDITASGKDIYVYVF